jgi:uridine kinase
MNQLIIIGGPSGVGKTTVARHLAGRLAGYSILSQDSFCTDRSGLLDDNDFYALDHERPDIVEHPLAADAIGRLRSGSPASIPVYIHAELRRSGARTVLPGHIIYEGLHALYDPELVAMAVLTVFLDAPEDVIYQRRRQRDVRDRRADPTRYDDHFRHFVWPGFERHVRPTMHRADLVIDGREEPDEIVERIIGGLTA